jgi:hypothetical protein
VQWGRFGDGLPSVPAMDIRRACSYTPYQGVDTRGLKAELSIGQNLDAHWLELSRNCVQKLVTF